MTVVGRLPGVDLGRVLGPLVNEFLGELNLSLDLETGVQVIEVR